MLLTDGEIRQAMQENRLVIENFAADNLQAASYDMRIGDKALLSGEQTELDVASRKAIVLDPGQFGLITTLERVTLPADMAELKTCKEVDWT